MLHCLRGNEVFLPFSETENAKRGIKYFADSAERRMKQSISYALFTISRRTFFYNTHYIVHERIFKSNCHILIYRFFLSPTAIACAAAVR